MTDRGASAWVPAVLVLLLFAVEQYAGRLRRADAPSKDRGSLWAIYLLIGGGYGLGFALWRHPPPPWLGAWATWAGAALAVAGLAFRVWAVATLGQYFTYVVKVSPDQKVVDTGPYRWLRHPSYTGALAAALGIALSMRYAWALALVGVPNFVGYAIRIFVEEKALAEGIGEPYRAYMRRTKRLIPFVW